MRTSGCVLNDRFNLVLQPLDIDLWHWNLVLRKHGRLRAGNFRRRPFIYAPPSNQSRCSG